MIYADNAATTQLDDEAFAVMKKYLREDYGNASQPYSFARAAKKLSTRHAQPLPHVSERMPMRFTLPRAVQKAIIGHSRE